MTSTHDTPASRARLALGLAAAGLAAALTLPLAAHEVHAGRIVIDHPYADPAPAGARESRVYLRALKNRGDKPDRLIGARTTMAAAVEIRHQPKGAPAATPAAALDLAPDATVKLRPGDEWRLVMVRPGSALKAGDMFKLTLRFEKAGETEVAVQVRKAVAASGAAAADDR
jgi:copper(I)-binding protein